MEEKRLTEEQAQAEATEAMRDRKMEVIMRKVKEDLEDIIYKNRNEVRIETADMIRCLVRNIEKDSYSTIEEYANRVQQCINVIG